MKHPLPVGLTHQARPRAGHRRTLRRLWRYLSRYRWLMLAASLLSLLGNALTLVSPKLSGVAIDAIVPGNVQMPVVIRCVLLMITLAFLSSGINWLLSSMMISLSRSVVKRMRKDLFEHITTLPISFFDTHQTGDVISVLSYDIDTVGASLSTDLTQILTSILTVIGSFTMMLTISPLLIGIFVITIPVSVLFTRYRSKVVRPLFSLRSKRLGQLNGYCEEAVSGLKTIRAYHQEEAFHTRFDKFNNEAVHVAWNADHTACVTGPTVNLINNFSMAAVGTLGAVLYMLQQISLGGVSSFVLYSRRFSGPINEFANIISELQSALAAAERVLTLLDLAPETPDEPDAVEVEHCEGHVVFQNVSFSYVSDRPVLKAISFEAKPGEMIAIVGETGCGKTTLMNLLMRFYDVSDGCILLDGTDIRHLTRDSLRRQFTMVLQDTWLFDGTIFENIAYGCPDATREDVERAAKEAHIHDMIVSMPNGYDTPVTDSGNSISKGQKQLMTIARAMLMKSSMLILDEATSNVDTQTEQRIQAAMLALMRNRTCFVIAHRLSTIVNADRILVMDDGRIVESGTHHALLARQGAYAELYNAQFDRTGTTGMDDA